MKVICFCSNRAAGVIPLAAQRCLSLLLIQWIEQCEKCLLCWRNLYYLSCSQGLLDEGGYKLYPSRNSIPNHVVASFYVLAGIGAIRQYLNHIGNRKPPLIVMNRLPDFLTPENCYACLHHPSCQSRIDIFRALSISDPLPSHDNSILRFERGRKGGKRFYSEKP